MKHPVGYHSQIDYVLHKDLGPSEVMRSVGRIHSGEGQVRDEEARGLRRTASALVMAAGTIVAANFLYTPSPEPLTRQDIAEICYNRAHEQAKMAGIEDSVLAVASLTRHCELAGGL